MTEVIRMTKEGFVEVTNTKLNHLSRLERKVLQAEATGPGFLRCLVSLKVVYVNLRVPGSQMKSLEGLDLLVRAEAGGSLVSREVFS